ncbi:asparagine synthetase [glutamine-hydrolyzing] isoform X1 [Strongylocentrotus purpuratus]|uniref:Asparagine synthetase [glutamine-hydrolyzing] n=1 Tax=Strongylocentrotus purpuratus TaxID=7668 RepID=A0A7M7T2I6_STRPU|nr:asparagine synthetase [glutamine-hydrolyzing] isoform X1 [Strongylocentrotus purpuratus]
MCGIWALFGGSWSPKTSEQVARLISSASKVSHRGPDGFRFEHVPDVPNCPCFMGFHRLNIVGGSYWMQPMRLKKYPHLWLMYNGEIYNYKKIQSAYGFSCETEVDGEAIIHLFLKGGAHFAASMLDGVFAFCILDTSKKQIHLGRDTYGIKPLFTSTPDDSLLLCSEAKGLVSLCTGSDIKWFPPGHVQTFNILSNGKVSTASDPIRFHSIDTKPKSNEIDVNMKIEFGLSDDVLSHIRRLFVDAVRKRLMSTRRIGCLLSGGLDSSLVAAVVSEALREQPRGYPLQTFSVGMEGSPDIAAARKVAAHIGSEHHEIPFTIPEGIAAVRDVIYTLETFDIMSIRPSIAMHFLLKYIREQTDTVVVFSGEGSDELAQGYLYFHKQPNTEAGDAESRRLLRDLYMYDVLRADRISSAHGLEIRVPFLDHLFTSYYLSLPAALRRPINGIEKFLIRKSFDDGVVLPDEILWRTKEGFTDGVSSVEKSWYVILAEHFEEQITDSMLNEAPTKFPFVTPTTKESYYYRMVFEEFFPGRAEWTPYMWMPRWVDAKDPVGRALKHYAHGTHDASKGHEFCLADILKGTNGKSV